MASARSSPAINMAWAKYSMSARTTLSVGAAMWEISITRASGAGKPTHGPATLHWGRQTTQISLNSQNFLTGDRVRCTHAYGEGYDPDEDTVRGVVTDGSGNQFEAPPLKL